MGIKNLAWMLVLVIGVASSEAQSVAQRGTARNFDLGKLPLSFEANRGQSAPQIKFISRGPGYRAYLMSNGMNLSLRTGKMDASAGSPSPSATRRSRNLSLEFRLLGAAANPAIVGENPLAGRVNYFIGSDPSKWQRNVPTYGQIRYKNVYRGIDLIYYGNGRQLEYDFAIAPNADPQQIRFEVKGANQTRVSDDGSLILATAGGELRFQAPVVYQESQGQRTPVVGGYVLDDANHVSFRLSEYDSQKALIIDPVLVYSTYLGGSGDEQVGGIAVDGTGSVYVVGTTDSSDFSLSAIGSSVAGSNQVFVAKFDATGKNLVYADYLGGSNDDYGYGIAVDGSGRAYVTGSTASSNFPLVHALQGTYPGGFNAFISKISTDGSTLMYSTYFGGNGSDIPTGVTTDNSGNLIVAGYTSSTNLPVANAYQSTVSPNLGGMYGNYGFITKVSPDGSTLVSSTYFGGSANVAFNCGGTPCWPQPSTTITAMAADANGNIYLTGTTNTYDLPVTQGAYLTTNSTQMNTSVGFVSKFSAAGSLQYSTYLYGGSGLPVGMSGIAVDTTGSAYVTGVALSDGTFPVTSTSICNPSTDGYACSYAFVTKFDPLGSSLSYSTFLGANNSALPQAIVVDSNRNAYVLGVTSTNAFNTVNALEPFSGGNDLLLVEIDASASSQLFATYLGGTADEQGAPGGMVLDSTGNLYIAGITTSADFPVTSGAVQGQLAGAADSFLMKIGPASQGGVSLTPPSLQFASQLVGSISPSQNVVLRNLGSAPLSISAVQANGDFSETNDCGSSVPAAGSCSLAITFTPTSGGTRSGSIVLQDDGAASPHAINLTGSGLGAGVSLSAQSLTFSSVAVGLSSAPQSVTLTNSGTQALTVANVQVAGSFAQTNNCPASLAPASNCTINVTFTPAATGSSNGTVTITDNAGSGSQTVQLTGTGADFALTASSTSATVKAGSNAAYSFTVSPLGGVFSSAVKLACSGLPANATCSFSAASVTPGSNPANVTLTIKTASTSALMSTSQMSRPIFAAFLQLHGLGLFGMMLAVSPRRRNRKLMKLMVLALLVGAMLFLVGCAGGTGVAPQQPQQPPTSNPTTYTVTVTGTSGALQHSLPLTLTVQ